MHTYLYVKPMLILEDPKWGEHKADPCRAQDDLSSGFGMEDRGVPREWNDEYQCLLELPNGTAELVRNSGGKNTWWIVCAKFYVQFV